MACVGRHNMIKYLRWYPSLVQGMRYTGENDVTVTEYVVECTVAMENMHPDACDVLLCYSREERVATRFPMSPPARS